MPFFHVFAVVWLWFFAPFLPSVLRLQTSENPWIQLLLRECARVSMKNNETLKNASSELNAVYKVFH